MDLEDIKKEYEEFVIPEEKKHIIIKNKNNLVDYFVDLLNSLDNNNKEIKKVIKKGNKKSKLFNKKVVPDNYYLYEKNNDNFVSYYIEIFNNINDENISELFKLTVFIEKKYIVVREFLDELILDNKFNKSKNINELLKTFLEEKLDECKSTNKMTKNVEKAKKI